MHIANHNPEFCIITPFDYLEAYATRSSSHLVLAHLVDNSIHYRDFYNSLDKEDHFIIMDNGAFELGESYKPNELCSLGTQCGADAVVLPDYPGCPGSKTIEGGEKVIDEIKHAGFHTMFVPQSEEGDLEDWIECYTYAAQNPDIDIIGMSILGMANAIPHIHIGYARVVLTQILIERGLFNFDKHHHYLGLNAGPALEIPSLLRLGALDTCDSSGPVWSAILGHEYSYNCDSFLPTIKPKMHVDFSYPWKNDDALHDRIINNIDMTLGLFDYLTS